MQPRVSLPHHGCGGMGLCAYNSRMPTDDERFMTEALSLAERGRGRVEPNPMVGAVLVRDGRVLGRGWHGQFGGPHAEVEALADARKAGADARGAMMYVTLEPCCHYGKTPPCTEALIDAGVSRVVAAMDDPDPQVARKGFQQLRRAGIEVTTGVCQAAARRLLGPYVKLRTTSRPWVICKWAQTAGGLVALAPDAERWISCEASRAWVHELRSRCDGILVGVGTVLADDPLLTNRGRGGRQPTRVVLDSRLRTPLDSQLVKTAGEVPMIVATVCEAAGSRTGEALRSAGAELLELPVDDRGLDLEALLDDLGRRNWTYLLVEGGPTVLSAFIHAGLADELLVFVAPPHPTDSEAAAGTLPRFDLADLQKTLALPSPQERTIGPDTLLRFLLRG